MKNLCADRAFKLDVFQSSRLTIKCKVSAMVKGHKVSDVENQLLDQVLVVELPNNLYFKL